MFAYLNRKREAHSVMFHPPNRRIRKDDDHEIASYDRIFAEEQEVLLLICARWIYESICDIQLQIYYPINNEYKK